MIHNELERNKLANILATLDQKHSCGLDDFLKLLAKADLGIAEDFKDETDPLWRARSVKHAALSAVIEAYLKIHKS